MKSLKCDKGKYERYFLIYEDGMIEKRKYALNEPIDCFHRLYLSPDDLKILYRIAKLNNKLYKDEANTDEILKKLEALEEEFQKTFKNPYRLDHEAYSDDYISYIFYDYEYDYIIERAKSGWYAWCRHSDVWSDGEFCKIDKC